MKNRQYTNINFEKTGGIKKVGKDKIYQIDALRDFFEYDFNQLLLRRNDMMDADMLSKKLWKIDLFKLDNQNTVEKIIKYNEIRHNDKIIIAEWIDGKIITINDMSNEILKQLKKQFLDKKYHPFFSHLNDQLIIKDGQLYHIDLKYFSDIPIKLGAFFETQPELLNSPFHNSFDYFFPFRNLSGDEELFVKKYFSMSQDKEIKIIYDIDKYISEYNEKKKDKINNVFTL
jgi:hypothetical protein